MSELSLLIFKKLSKIQKQLNRIEQNLSLVLESEAYMTAEFDVLTAAVTDVSGAVDSVLTLVTGLSAYIKAHANDPAALLAFAKDLETKKDAIVAAVAANPVPGDEITPPAEG
jgi:hypothetical protein